MNLTNAFAHTLQTSHSYTCQPSTKKKVIKLSLCFLFLSAGVYYQIAYASENSNSRKIVHDVSGWSSDLSAYNKAFMELVLNNSRDKFGDYKLEISSKNMTIPRTAKALRNARIHSTMSSNWNKEYEADESIDMFRAPFLGGLLGLRQFIVLKSRVNEFEQIKSFEELKKFTAGQGEHWPDTIIYENAGIRVVKASKYENLFPMLAQGRFDYLPLSYIEIQTALKKYQKQYPNLTIAQEIYVYYPLPIYLALGKKDKEVYERIRYGLNSSIENGDLQTLVKRRFLVRTDEFSEQNNRIFFIENSLISGRHAKVTTDYFRKNYLGIR